MIPDITFMVLGRIFAAEPYVLSVRGKERTNALYSFEVRVACDAADDLSADDSLLMMPVLVQLNGGELPRLFHGVVLGVSSESGTYQRRRIWRFRIGPRLALLDERRFSRIFTGKTAVETATAILDEHRIPWRLRLTSPYPVRAYTVQYHETDYAFIRRLLSEVGVFFTFDHPAVGGPSDATNMGGMEVMVLGDSAQSYSPIEGTRRLELRADANAMLAGDSHLFGLHAERRVRPAFVLERAYDFQRPTVELRDSTGRPAAQMIYTFGGEGDESHPEIAVAAVRLDQERRDAFIASGESACRRLMPGRTLDLEGHDIPSLGGSYVVKSVEHEAYAGDATPAGKQKYRNSFVAAPANVPLRPKRRRPVEAHQAETAVVVGPKDKEIHTDGYGRVQVQFHWDLAGKRDGGTSTWLRVEQGWAGTGWGAQILPRVGMEVVVTFLGGDVDRPLITGCVYNATHPLPFPQPAELTKTGLRSSTTPGGDGYHEISIDDAKGAEMLFIRAQRDQRRVVGNDDEERVVNDQRIVIGRDRTAKIGERDLVDAGKEHTVTVGGRAVGGGGGGGGAQGTFTMSGKNASLDVKGDIAMKAGGSMSLSATDVSIHGDSSVSVDAPTVTVNATDVAINGSATVKITGGLITIDGGNVVIVGATITEN